MCGGGLSLQCIHHEKLEKFLGRYWDYYRKLLEFKETPTSEEATCLSAEFSRLFSTKTDYHALDYRITKTIDKKPELLMALKHPEVSLQQQRIGIGRESTGSQARREPAHYNRRRYKG